MGEDNAEYGPFFRKKSSTQTDAVADAMVRSGELWGRTPYGGMEPTVQAYTGELGDRIGVEFFTTCPPRSGTPPGQADWRPGMAGVWLDGEFAKIRIRVTRNTQTGLQC